VRRWYLWLLGATAAGGIGLVSGTGLIAKGRGNGELVRRIRNARRLAHGGIIGVGIMYAVAQFDEILDVSIQEGVDLVVIGAGFAREPFNKLAAAGIPGFAGVVVESGQAGGHLGPRDTSISTWDLFPPVLKTLRDGGFTGPVVAAGGIRYGWEMRRIMEMGADGVQFGTLFAMTTESSAPAPMKEAWIRSKGSKVVSVSPVGMPGRVVMEQDIATLPRLAAPHQGCIDCLKICLHRDDPSMKHCIHLSLQNSSRGRLSQGNAGEVLNGLVFAGGRVGEIDDIVPARTRIDRLMAEFEQDDPEAVAAGAAAGERAPVSVA